MAFVVGTFGRRLVFELPTCGMMEGCAEPGKHLIKPFGEESYWVCEEHMGEGLRGDLAGTLRTEAER